MSVEVLERPARDANVEASIHFLEPSAEKPNLTYDAANVTLSATAIYTPHKVLIRDARGLSALLDVEGFALTRQRSAIDFGDEDEIVRIGHAEAANLVREATGAARVVVFDHTVRRRQPGAPRQPSVRVHVDYTADSAPQRVRDLMGDEAEALLQKRVVFVNVWRAIRHPVSDWPLVLADARTIAARDMVGTDLIYPDRRGEIYGLIHHPEQRWYYYPDLALDEALLIKCYDSRTDVARFTPHTAFDNPLTPPGAPPRESIEFRAIAFFD